MELKYMTGEQFDALTNGDAYDWQDDVIQIVDCKDALCVDVEASGQRIVPILKRIEKTLTRYGYKDHAGWVHDWVEQLRDRNGRKYFLWAYTGDDDRRRGCWSYSWGIEQHDESWYVYLNISKGCMN